jgi:protein-disulfide isomerase
VASRKQQKEALRAQREQVHAQLRSQQQRRRRIWTLGGVVSVVIVAAAVAIIASSGGGAGKTTGSGLKNVVSHFTSNADAVADMASVISGIPQSGNRLGNPHAKVTVTEYGDLVCSTCDAFALTSEPEFIADEVRTGKAKLLYRAVDTASETANQSEFVDGQVAARSAGLQNLEWDYILLMYNEQPISIGGKDSELVPYISTAYLQNIAQQVPGLNLIKWQQGLTNSTLIGDVATDGKTANQLGVDSTPTVFLSGPKGTVQWDKGSDILPPTATALAQLKALVKQVS